MSFDFTIYFFPQIRRQVVVGMFLGCSRCPDLVSGVPADPVYLVGCHMLEVGVETT